MMIRFTGGSSDSSEEGGDLGLWVEPSSSVRAVKRQVSPYTFSLSLPALDLTGK